MKKNAIAHMMAEKEPTGKRIARLHPVSRLLCLLLAILIWLAVVNLGTKTGKNGAEDERESETQASETEHA